LLLREQKTHKPIEQFNSKQSRSRSTTHLASSQPFTHPINQSALLNQTSSPELKQSVSTDKTKNKPSMQATGQQAKNKPSMQATGQQANYMHLQPASH
jgi:hypothetical protein